MTYDFYIKKDSFLHRLDPRIKFVLTVSLIFLAFIFETLIMLVGILLLIHILFITARIPYNRILSIWKMMLPVNIMIILLWPVFSPEGSMVLFSIGSRGVSMESILKGIAMAVRITNLGMACFILLITTDQTKIVLGLVKVGIPYEWGLTFAVALRYLPTFYNIINMVTDAQKTRGLELDKGSFIKKLKSYMPIIVSVIITGLKASTNLANAMETRAFGVSAKKRTYLHELKMSAVDYIVFSFIICCISGLTVSRFFFGYGTDLIHLLPV